MLLGRFFVSKTSPHEREQLKLRLRELEKEDKIRIVGKILNAEELERRPGDPRRMRRGTGLGAGPAPDGGAQRAAPAEALFADAAKRREPCGRRVLIACGVIYYTHVGARSG